MSNEIWPHEIVTDVGTTVDINTTFEQTSHGDIVTARRTYHSQPTLQTKIGQIGFITLLLLVPIMIGGIFWWLTGVGFTDRTILTTTQLPPGSVVNTATGEVITISTASRITSTSYITPSTTLGVLDPSLGKTAGFFIGILVFLVAGIIEISLWLLYGAFYVNNPENKTRELGLPDAMVRVFVMIILVFAVLAFAFLPASWSDNKAVVFLLGLISTIVGFYFGSKATSDASKAASDAGSATVLETDKVKATVITPAHDAQFPPSPSPTAAPTTPAPTEPAASTVQPPVDPPVAGTQHAATAPTPDPGGPLSPPVTP